MREKIFIVGDVCDSGHGGKYGVVFLEDNQSVTFSLKEEDKVWQGHGSSNLRKGDWVCIGDIRPHGTKSPPMMRAYFARLATEQEVEENSGERKK